MKKKLLCRIKYLPALLLVILCTKGFSQEKLRLENSDLKNVKSFEQLKKDYKANTGEDLIFKTKSIVNDDLYLAGSLSYSGNGLDIDAFYSFKPIDATSEQTFSQETSASNDYAFSVGGYLPSTGKYYGINSDASGYVQFATLNPTTWEIEGTPISVTAYANWALSLTVDPSAATPTGYGIYRTSSTATSFYLGKYDLTTGVSTAIVSLTGNNRLVFVAAAEDGTLYGLTYNRTLVSINKSTGARTSLKTNVINSSYTPALPSSFNHGAVIVGNKLYWSGVITYSSSNYIVFYEIDITSGGSYTASIIDPTGTDAVFYTTGLFKFTPPSLADDLAVLKFTGPTSSSIGSTADYTVSVKNKGIEDVADNTYTVNFYQDGTLYESKPGVAIASSENTTFTLSVPTILADAGKTYSYYAVVNFAADELITNNTSSTIKTKIDTPKYPAINDLAASVSNKNVNLTWSAPTLPTVETITESFEDYTSFIISNIGDWTLRDVDASATYGFNGTTFTNSGAAMSYIVFNGVEVAVNNFTANSGEQFLASFAASTPPNNDWLISPLLSGNAQDISFYAKSYTNQYGLERFIVYYSTTDTEIASFTQLSVGNYIEAPITWTLYTYSLPANAKYFAVRCVSNDAFVFMIDDVTFEKGAPNYEILGYNIYRNNSKVNNALVTSVNYTDANLDNGTYNYNVSTIYNLGESKYSNTVEAIIDLSTGNYNPSSSSVKITSYDNKVKITATENSKITIYSVDGKTIYSSVMKSDNEVVTLGNRGVYIVRVGEKVEKIIVR
ncbi:MAG: DUF6383 domain-containing protein [Paludibacteraceae bacterium]